jgi:hypothetical protein
MTTFNTTITSAWTKLADSSNSELLVTWNHPVDIEVAVTTTDVAPTVVGHSLNWSNAITRAVLGTGYVWARCKASVAGVTLIVTK